MIIRQVSKYLSVGGFCTLMVWILWNIFIFTLERGTKLDRDLIFSASQILSALLMIYPSFWLNSIFTFKDLNLKSSKRKVTAKVCIIYILSPIVSTFLTFLLQSLIPFDSFIIVILNQNIKIGLYLLQALALVFGMGLNFSGQKWWLYSK